MNNATDTLYTAQDLHGQIQAMALINAYLCTLLHEHAQLDGQRLHKMIERRAQGYLQQVAHPWQPMAGQTLLQWLESFEGMRKTVE